MPLLLLDADAVAAAGAQWSRRRSRRRQSRRLGVHASVRFRLVIATARAFAFAPPPCSRAHVVRLASFGDRPNGGGSCGGAMSAAMVRPRAAFDRSLALPPADAFRFVSLISALPFVGGAAPWSPIYVLPPMSNGLPSATSLDSRRNRGGRSSCPVPFIGAWERAACDARALSRTPPPPAACFCCCCCCYCCCCFLLMSARRCVMAACPAASR